MRSLLVCLMLACGAIAGEEPGRELAAGMFLIANRNLPDPNFSETVVLLLEYNSKGALGLVINEPTKISLAKLFDEVPSAKQRSDVAYIGGPVQFGVVHALMRSKTKPQEARQVFGDVYVVNTRAELEKALQAKLDPSSFRAYMGYSGWGPGQLDKEMLYKSWIILRADADSVFDPKPEEVWNKLVKRTKLQMAIRPQRRRSAD